jgi:ATP-binding cassette subfamily B protein
MTSSHHPLRRLWEYAAGHRRRIVTATTFSVLNKTFDLAPPVLIGTAVDVVVRREDSMLAGFGVVDTRDQLIVLAVLTFIIWALESLFEYLHSIWWRNLAQTIQHELRIDAYAHTQTLDMRFFEDRSTGGLMAVLNDDINQLERFLDGGANNLLQVATTVVLVGIGFFGIAWQVAWLAFIPIPLILWGSFRFQRRIAPRYSAVREQVGVLNGQLSNNLAGMATIKSFTTEDREVARISQESELYQTANRRAIRLSSAFSPLIRIVILAGFTATLLVGGFRALDGLLEVGAYSVMVFLTQRLLWPLTRLGETFDLFQRAMASTNRVLDLLAVRPEITGGPTPLETSSIDGHLTFDAVDFSYVDGYPVLASVDIDMPAGHTTAIVGATGAGKTTIIKLLLRFYDPTNGRVTLDGHDLSDLDLGDLRRAIGLVSQDVFLFHGTVHENIAYARPDARMEDVIAAARVAEAHEFIESLPQGYATIVGERGQKLSGGQRQRLSIARAILADPPVLILDEATSSVDNETEAAIQRSLERISVDRTTIVIAHRLCQVAERGTHEDLIAADGLYASLWKVQTGAAVPWHVG